MARSLERVDPGSRTSRRENEAETMNGSFAVGGATTPSVIVVDPRFDIYASLATAAREGKLDLHLRSSGTDAMRLARRIRVDAWLVAEELDNMAGHDFVELLAAHDGGGGAAGKVAMVATVPWQPGGGRTRGRCRRHAGAADLTCGSRQSAGSAGRSAIVDPRLRRACKSPAGDAPGRD